MNLKNIEQLENLVNDVYLRIINDIHDIKRLLIRTDEKSFSINKRRIEREVDILNNKFTLQMNNIKKNIGDIKDENDRERIKKTN